MDKRRNKKYQEAMAKAKAGGWQQWVKNSSDHLAVENGCYFDTAFAKTLHSFLAKNIRKTTAGAFEILPWQWEVLASLLCWKRKDGKRRFNRFYVSTSKKAGKSCLMACLIIALLLEDQSNIYTAATSARQASLIYREVARMVNTSPALKDRLTPKGSYKVVEFGGASCEYAALSYESSGGNVEGINGHVICDELHVWRGRDYYDALKGAGLALANPLFGAITTAGIGKHNVCREQYEYAKKVLDGYPDDAYYAYIKEAPLDADIASAKTWEMANPGKVPYEFYRQELLKCQADPGAEFSFRRYYLNQWQDTNEVRYFDAGAWDKCTDPKTTLESLTGKTCYAGLDLSSHIDTSALSLVFPRDDGGYDILCKVFIPQEGAHKKAEMDNVPYLVWEKEGWVETTPGNKIDQGRIRQYINTLAKQYKIAEILYDPHDASLITSQLTEDGHTMIQVTQSYGSLSSPTKLLQALILDQKINHFGNPVLRQHAVDTVCEVNTFGDVRPSKGKSHLGASRIDAILATVMALAGASRHQQDNASVYDTRGILVF